MAQSGPSLGRFGSATPFVGRATELNALAERLALTRGGAGGVVLVAGEPGIGKTRLVAELAERASADGWAVLTGRAVQADGLPPFLPFVEALRSHIERTNTDVLRAQLGDGTAEIAVLVRELAAVLPDLPPTPSFAPESERYRLFESVSDFLIAIARTGIGDRRSGVGMEDRPEPRPLTPDPPGLLLVLDDLQWADVSSLQLLLHFVRRLAAQPVLVLGTFREMEVERGHPLSAVLAELVRAQVSEQISLRGLGEADVGRFIALAAELSPSSGLVSSVYQETEGNPLFVVELVRLLIAEGRLREDSIGPWRLTIPQTVQQVIGRRLDRLSAAANETLTLGAVLGREFSLLALEHAGELHGNPLLEALEEAETARVIAAIPETPGCYTFTHPLIRETLYGQILTSRRVRLHRAIGETLERLYTANREAYLAELAYHFFQAAPGGDVAKAVEYARRAGDRSMAVFAYEEAARLYESALQALTLRAPDEPLRCELMLALGEAQTRAGQTATAKETFRRTAELTMALGLAQLQGRAALGYGGYRGQPGYVDTELVRLAEAALVALAPTATTSSSADRALRARLLARLAMELYLGHERERADALSREALDLARQSGDRAALAAALVGRHYATHNPDNLKERLAITEELIRLAEAAGEREVALQGHYLRAIDVLEAADIDAFEREIAAHDALASEVRQPLYLWRTDLLRSTLATLQGRFAEGEQLANRAYALADRAQIASAFPAYGIQLVAIRLWRGGVEQFIPAYYQLIARYPTTFAYRAGLLISLVAADRTEEAREQLDALAAQDFTDIQPDDDFLTTLACIAQSCAALGDQRRASALYDRLAPYADRAVVVNAAIGCLGAVAEYLGMLALTVEDWPAAERHLRDALTINTRMGATPFILRTRLARAALLLRRNGPGEGAQAQSIGKEVLVGARALGLAGVVAEATRLLGETATPDAQPAAPISYPDGLTEREVEVLRLVADGRTNREIAEMLVLSTRTVDHHIANIYRKINARRRADAAAYAQRIGVTPPVAPDR